MATEEGTKRVDEGVKLAAQARQSIDQLSSVITESAQAAVQVVAGGRQQVSGIEQIALAMQNIDQATVQSLVSTRQMERAAQNLSQLAHNLAELVAQYEL
jgi:methyl-accepting chemotaxis protein